MAAIERTLTAGAGLALICEPPYWRIAWGEPDWLGPLGLRVSGATIDPRLAGVSDGVDDLGAFVCGAVAGLAAPLRATVRAYRERALLVFRLQTDAELQDLGNGTFADPSVAWPALRPKQRSAGGVAPGTRTYGHQYAEF